jgi:hypothetical protein
MVNERQYMTNNVIAKRSNNVIARPKQPAFGVGSAYVVSKAKLRFVASQDN